MGEPINSSNIPELLEKEVVFRGPLYPGIEEIVSGVVKYIDNSKTDPKIVYVKNSSEGFMRRVDFTEYSEAEIED